jgi:hypothetical protein
MILGLMKRVCESRRATASGVKPLGKRRTQMPAFLSMALKTAEVASCFGAGSIIDYFVGMARRDPTWAKP